jgi:hypothetical protein
VASKPNADVGKVDCPIRTCDREAHVRKMAKGRRKGQLYAMCPAHGPIMIRGEDYQEHLLEKSRMNGPGAPAPEPAPKPANDPKPAPAPSPEPAATPKAKRGFFDW